MVVSFSIGCGVARQINEGQMVREDPRVIPASPTTLARARALILRSSLSI